jgi:DNA-binding MarR family transcriptional regulator
MGKPIEAAPLSFSALLAQREDLPYYEAGAALVKAGFLWSNRCAAPSYGISTAEADVLTTIAKAEETSLSCTQIADRTVITKGGITKILDRLEARRLVRRLPSRDDGRSFSIQLTPKGMELCRKLTAESAGIAREIFQKAFRPEQMKQFRKLITLLLLGVEAHRREAQVRESELNLNSHWR